MKTAQRPCRAPLAEGACSALAAVGSEVCRQHIIEIFGYGYGKHRVERSRGISLLWVAKGPGLPFRGQGFRTHAKALAEADYQARLRLWLDAHSMASAHSTGAIECDCQADRLAGRQQRIDTAWACPRNLAARWVREHTEPQPPED